jgi:hypothetical protein
MFGPISGTRFKLYLTRSVTARHLDLSRADLVEAMKESDVTASETRHPMGAEFHFVRAPAPKALASPEATGAGRKPAAAQRAPKTRPAPTPYTQTPERVEALRTKLSAYTEGDRKVEAIRAAGERYAVSYDAVEARKADRDAIEAKLKGVRKKAEKEAIYSELDAANGAVREAQDELSRHQGRTRYAVLQILGVADEDRMMLDHQGTVTSTHEGALAWLTKVIRRSGTEQVSFRFEPFRPGDDLRPYYNFGKIHLDDRTSVTTAVHEMGHMLEEMVPGWNAAAQAFLRHRVGDEPLTQLRTAGIPNSSYDKDEWGRKDRFDEAFGEAGGWYAGKDYGLTASEITAMGVEQLFRDPINFARRDPEYCKFILGLLDGVLR